MRKIQGKKKKSPFLIVLMVVCLAVFVFCAVQIAKILLEDQAGNSAAEEIVKKYVITQDTDPTGGENKEPAYAVDFAVSAYQAYQNAHTSTEAEHVPGRAAR